MDYFNIEAKFLEGCLEQEVLNEILDDVKSYKKTEDGVPIILEFASTIKTFEFLEENNVDFLQFDDKGNNFLLKHNYRTDDICYLWLVKKFRQLNKIDLYNKNGVTALSSCIKLNELNKAEMLLKNGASPYTKSTISRYGNKKIIIQDQIVNIMGCDEDAINAFKLLMKYGYTFTSKHKEEMIEGALQRDRLVLADWVKREL